MNTCEMYEYVCEMNILDHTVSYLHWFVFDSLSYTCG